MLRPHRLLFPEGGHRQERGSLLGVRAPSLVQTRLRELVLIYLVIFGMAIAWRQIVLGREALGTYGLPVLIFNGVAVMVLAGIALMLSGESVFRLARLKALELGMIVMLACMLSVAQYRLMLEASLRDDTMVAQLVFKNIVLITSVLILTYGLYVPKSWRRAALVVGPLAVLPFATLLVLYLRHPEPMGWLERGWRKSDTARLTLFTFDAMILLIVAAGSAFGRTGWPGCGGRLPRPGIWASIACGSGLAAAGWERSTSPSTSSSSAPAPSS